MSDVTPRLQLLAAQGSDLVTVLTQLYNNFHRLDDYSNFFVCTAATRPTGTNRFVGLGIYETDTGKTFMWDGSVWNYIPQKLIANKAANQTLTASSVVLQDVSSLSVAVVSGRTYKVEANLFYDAPTASDIKFAFIGPGASTFIWWAAALILGSTSQQDLQMLPGTIGGSELMGGTGGTVGTTVKGTLVAAASGTFKVQAAQATSSASVSTVLAGSDLTLELR